jgi:hypothetical protein
MMRRGEVAPDGARRLHPRQARHLYVEDAQLGALLQRHGDGLLAVGGLDDGAVGGELALQQLAQVAALRDVVFGDQDWHGGSVG